MSFVLVRRQCIPTIYRGMVDSYSIVELLQCKLRLALKTSYGKLTKVLLVQLLNKQHWYEVQPLAKANISAGIH